MSAGYTGVVCPFLILIRVKMRKADYFFLLFLFLISIGLFPFTLTSQADACDFRDDDQVCATVQMAENEKEKI